MELKLKNKLFILLFTSLIIINSYSMEEKNEMMDSNETLDPMDECEKESKKRKIDQLRDSQEDSTHEEIEASEEGKRFKYDYKSEDKDLGKLKAIKKSLRELPIATDDIFFQLAGRITINKAFRILSQVPDELVLYFLDIFIEQKISCLFRAIISNKKFRPYFSNQENSTAEEHMSKFLDSMFNTVNKYFKDLYVNLIILIGLIDRLKLGNIENEESNLSAEEKQLLELQNVFKIIKQSLEEPKCKRKIRNIFNNAVLNTFNMFENPNLLKACEELIVQEQRCFVRLQIPEKEKPSFVKRWNFLLDYLIEHPKQIPHDLKIYCGHWLAMSNRTKDLYKLISTHNCPLDNCSSDECKNDYILDKDFKRLIGPPQFKKGTLLMTALYFKAFDVARCLIETNVQIDKEDSRGDTPLMYCIEGFAKLKITCEDIINYQDMVRLLLNAGITKNLSKAMERFDQFDKVIRFDIIQGSNRNVTTHEKLDEEMPLLFKKVKADILNQLAERARFPLYQVGSNNGQIN